MRQSLSEKMIDLNIRLQNLIEGFDELTLNKSVSITTDLKILHILKRDSGATPTTLIDNIGIAKGNLALICTKLINKKLIEKTHNELDRRSVSYKLTSLGEQEYDRISKITLNNFTKVLAYKNNLKDIELTIDKLSSLIEVDK